MGGGGKGDGVWEEGSHVLVTSLKEKGWWGEGGGGEVLDSLTAYSPSALNLTSLNITQV